MSGSPVDGDTAESFSNTNSLKAKIIFPGEHPITREKLDRDALYILEKLGEAGFAGYLVGGGVRDLYLGKRPKDFDISTDARPGQLRRLFPNSNTIGRRFRLVQVFFRGGKTIEVSTLRSLSEHDLEGPETVLAPNNTYGTLSEDAQRRDLTINSLFYEIENNTIIDYLNGTQDLNDAIIRIIGDANRRIGRDPVRMMRAIRHAARNGFAIEETSWKAICDNSSKLSLCPPSRLRDEFLKDLYSGAVAPWFDLAAESGVFSSLMPIYNKLLNKDKHSTRSLLHNIFATIDRANNMAIAQGGHRQPDFFLFALLLTPWAESRWQLYSKFMKGAALFHIGKQLREELDQTIGVELNLRRSMRQEMTNLLLNLALLINNRQGNNWPKWLKRKSYFQRARSFYSLYIEATTGEQLFQPQNMEPSPPALQEEPNPPPINNDTQQHPARPAFSRKTKGGIFGFKK